MRIVSALVVIAITLPSAAGARPLVAVIDSGIVSTPELAPLLIGEVDAAARPARSQLEPRYDHGTKVATVLARAARQPVSILSVRVDEPVGCKPSINPPCQRNPAVIAWAIYAAVAHRADVINISMALPDAPVISRAVAFAAWHGTQVVIAAGNDGRSVPGNLVHARAGYPNTVLVGALEADGRRWVKSNRPAGELTPGYSFAWRWGAQVPTAQLDGSATLASGTSIAAPIEAAARADRRAGWTGTLVSKPLPSRALHRPVMLAATTYPDFRARACQSSAGRPAGARCLGSSLIA